MRYIGLIVIVFMVSMIVNSCKPVKKEMPLEDFYKIQNEIIDTDHSDESMEMVVKKYGYTLKEYKVLDEKVKTDPKLKEKLGEIILKTVKDKVDIKESIKEDVKK